MPLMKVLIVHNRYRSTSSSGEDRVVDQEYRGLVEAGHDVELFERWSDDIASRALHRQALVPLQVVWSRRSARDLEIVLGDNRPDVVHFHNLFPLLSPSVLSACRRSRVPSVITLHNYRQICVGGTLFRTGATCRECVDHGHPLPGVRHGCYRNSSLATVPYALSSVANRRLWQTVPSAYIFLSEAQRREFEPLGLPSWRSFVKANLVPDTDRRDQPEGLVVYCGRLADVKGLRVLMRAWDGYRSARPLGGLRLAIAGSGPLEPEVRAWAVSRPSVELVGKLSREACAALVRRAAAVVVPSEWREPFGLVVAEAMAAAVPPVATAHGAFPELITDRVDGLLYPPGDHDALAGLLGQVEDHPEWAIELGMTARATYERRFAPSVVIAQLEEIYRFAVDNPRWVAAAGEPRRTGGASTSSRDPASPMGTLTDGNHTVAAHSTGPPSTVERRGRR